MEKLAGGSLLDCGHQQVIASARLARYREGLDQHAVWCIECDDWTRLTPVLINNAEGKSKNVKSKE